MSSDLPTAGEDCEEYAPAPEALLQRVLPSSQVTVRFGDVSAFVQVLVTPGAPAKPKKQPDVEAAQTVGKPAQAAPASKETQVLCNLSGSVEPGQMLALMGPSGSGKSSLLTVLGGRNRARITGTLHFNGTPLNKPMKRRLGFVTQDDLLYAELTAYETLYFAAMLRLPKSWTTVQKQERVEMVLHGLHLGKARDTIIGSHMLRGVSGGERKRVSIACELLINPSVIMLDEPTSGLDSTTALKLVQTLRALASGGRAVLASIHQPSSRLYQEFDKLMLLSDGCTMYYGDAQGLRPVVRAACERVARKSLWCCCVILPFMSNAHELPKIVDPCLASHHVQGVPVPFGVSIPDHLLDLACGDLTGSSKRKAPEAKVLQQRLLTAYQQRTIGLGDHGIEPADVPTADRPRSHLDVAVPAAVAAAAKVGKISPGAVSRSSSGEVGDATGRELAHSDSGRLEGSAADGKWGASWVKQVHILTQRCLRTRRFQSLSVQRFAETLCVAILVGCFWFQVGAGDPMNASEVNDVSGLLFFTALYLSFSTMFTALFSFPADFNILVKERQSGMYRLSAYYAARTLSDVPMDCLMPSMFIITTYWMAGLRASVGAFFSIWASVMLCILVAQSVGLILSATVANQKTMLSCASVYTLSSMLVAGFYVTNVPVWIAWAKYLSYIRYGYILLLKIEFGGRGYSCHDYYEQNPAAPPGMTWCPVSASGLLPADVDAPKTVEVCVLLLWLFALRYLVYVILARRTSFRIKMSG